jgi:hypothetical protein
LDRINPWHGPVDLCIFLTGTLPLIPWGNFLAPWAAEWLPNLEAEIGLVLVIAGSIPLYWEMRRSR